MSRGAVAPSVPAAPPPSRGTAPKPVLRRLLPPLAAMVVLLTAGAGALMLRLHRHVLDANLHHLVTLVADDLAVSLAEQGAGLALAAQPIATDPRVAAALASGDTAALRRDWGPLYETLHRRHALTHFYFLDANRVCLLRMHQPQKAGDRIDRFTAREAERTGRTASGIELGPLGTFTLRVVEPVRADGRLLGYVELGKEIEDALRGLQQHSGNEVAVVIRKAFLDRSTWEAGMHWLGREAEWDRLPHGVVIFASQGRLPEPAAALADPGIAPEPNSDQAAGGPRDQGFTLDGRPWRLFSTPLTDAAGRTVGELLVMRNIGPEQRAFMRLLTRGGAAAALLAAVLLGLILVLLRRTDRAIRIREAQRRASEQSHHRALQEREARYRLLFEASHDAMLTIGLPSWRCTSANPAACTLFAAPDEAALKALDLLGLSPECQPDGRPSAELAAAAVAKALAAGSSFCEWTHRRLDGSAFPATVLLNRVEMAGQTLIQATVRNISEQKAADLALEEERRRLAGILTGTRAGTWEWNVQTGAAVFNARWAEIVGYTLGELAPLSIATWQRLVHPDDLPVSDALLERHFRGETDYYECEGRMRHKQGGWVWVQDRGRVATWTADGRPLLMQGTHQDITALKEHQCQLEQIAHYDALTTLPNRVLLSERLEQAMEQSRRRNRRLAVAYLDLDGFKTINDRHGHAAGDQILIAAAARMKRVLRESDTLARLGGDEFVAVLVDLPDLEACVPLLTRLLAAAAEPSDLGGLACRLTASAGVTVYPQAESVDADQLLRQSDQAMYQAKLAGKNGYQVFDPEQDRSIRGLHEGLEHIRRALAEHQLVLHYQPKVNLRTGALVGAEALLRWQHPHRGLLTPAAILPLIENHPLALDLGDWVLGRVLDQLQDWQAAGLTVPVSINIGARQIQQASFVAGLRARLAAHPGLPRGSLQLEILETSAIDDLGHVSQVIAECRALGIDSALDDFGTGYSSLSYLKRLPVGLLKIDQSFVRDMLDDPEDLAIVESILGLARAFHRQVMAEGVETRAHAELLLALGCELAQGYGIARPMPPEDLPAWLAAWRPDPRWADLAPVARADLPILYAGVEHRAWISAVERCLRGEREAPPPLAADQCPFGAWLLAHPAADPAARVAHRSLDVVHRQVHRLAAELLDLDARGRTREALTKVGDLHDLRDTLWHHLAELVGRTARGL